MRFGWLALCAVGPTGSDWLARSCTSAQNRPSLTYASARLRMGARAHANFDNRCAVQRRIRQPVMFCTKVPFTGRKTALYH